MRWELGVVFSYWNLPVSVTSPMYSASAIAGVRSTPRSGSSSQMISAVHEAPSTTRFAVPKRVLSWWWSMFTMCASSRPRKLTGMRSRLPQSRNTIVRSLGVLRERVAHGPERQVAVLVGQGKLFGGQEHHGVLAERPERLVHRDERAERVAVRVLVRGEEELLAPAELVQDLFAGGCQVDRHVGGELLPEELADPHPPLGGVVVAEVELRSSLQAQLGPHAALQVAVRGGQALEGLSARPARRRARSRTRAHGADPGSCRPP